MTIYHVTLSGAVTACNAKKKSCRYRTVDHFHTKEEGKTALLQREAAGYTSPSMLKKATVFSAESVRELKLTARHSTSPEDAGEQFIGMVEKTLPLSFSSVELTLNTLEEIGSSVREAYSSLAQSGRPLKNQVRGVRSREVKNSLTFVPDRVKTLLSREEIVSSWKTDKNVVGCNKRFYKLDTPRAVRKLSEDGPLAIDPDTGKTYWTGELPRSVNGFRVSSSYQLLTGVTSRSVKVKAPIYSLEEPEHITARRLLIPNSSVSTARSEAILHGYSHIIQDLIPWTRGDSLFEELAAGSKYSSKLQTVLRMGFPHEALGVRSNELFPLSSSAFFFPEVDENSWSVRAEPRRVTFWTAGVWVKLAFCDLSSS